MVVNNQAVNSNNASDGQIKQVFTFFVEDMMFGLDVNNVLMLGQEVNDVQRLPVEERGFQGITKFQGAVVPVLDFAHRIGVRSGMDTKTSLIEMLAGFEDDHIKWMDSLEEALRNDKAFDGKTDIKSCGLTNWAKKFQTRDETLKELLDSFEEPHQTLHDLADKLMSMHQQGQTDKAIEELRHHRSTTLRKLISLFSRVHDQVENAMRQVLLFVTLDGKTPLYALIIDEINDVINYQASDFQASTGGALAQIRKIDQVIDGVYTCEDTPDCLYFNINKIVDISQLTVEEEQVAS